MLDPGRDELDELWAAVGRHVLETATGLGSAPAYTGGGDVEPAAFRLTESSAEIAELLATIERVERAGINQTSGGHFAFIPGGGLFPAALGDLLADVGNRYVGVRFAAPAAAEMERSLIRWMSDLVGYPATAGGDLTSGASIAHLEGIVTARDAAQIGSADVSGCVAYLTSQTHHCIEKALRIAGLGDCVIRRIALDERMHGSAQGPVPSPRLRCANRARRAPARRGPWLQRRLS